MLSFRTRIYGKLFKRSIAEKSKAYDTLKNARTLIEDAASNIGKLRQVKRKKEVS
jgi:hypothetical protein